MATQDTESKRQIHQMINFILNEARDKAQEIEAKAIEDFNIEKLKLVQQMKSKLRQEYQLKTKKMEIERSIARSNAANKARLRKMECKCSFVDSVIQDASKQLLNAVSNKSQYKTICTDLITQGLFRLLEDTAYVRCRPEDEALIKECFPLACANYSKIIKAATGIVRNVSLVLDKENYLPRGSFNSKGEDTICLGGIIITSTDRKIIIDNTLDARLRTASKDTVPTLRLLLFAGL